MKNSLTTRISTLAVGIAACLGFPSSSRSQPAPAAAAPTKPKWEKSAGVGVTATTGNTDSVLFTANITALKKWEKNEVRLGADGAYGENDSVKNAESARGYGQYNRLFNERVYGYLRGELSHDAIADVDYRLTLSPGLGYYFIKKPVTTLSGEVGPGFIHEKQGGKEDSYMTLRLAERFEHKFNERVRLWQSLEVLPQVDDWGNFLLNFEIGIESKLTEKLALRLFAVDTYDNEPAPGRKENDLKVVTSLNYAF